MNVLVTGAAGLLGAHVSAALQATGDVTGVDRHPWWGDRPLRMLSIDLLNGDAVAQLMDRTRPDVVVHCAAFVDVDGCERDPARAFAENAEMPGRLAKAAGRECLFVYVTTDGVFRGDAPLATEDTPPEPRTVYGRSKREGEQRVASEAPHHLILRTNFFGWSSGRKPTFGEWLYRALAARQPITLFDDFHFTPLYVGDFVAAICGLIDGGARGLFHVTGGERISKYAFGMELARQGGFDTAGVVRGSIDAAHLAAPRPKDMSLSTARIAAQLGHLMPSAAAGIARFLADRERPLSARMAPVRLGLRA